MADGKNTAIVIEWLPRLLDAFSAWRKRRAEAKKAKEAEKSNG